MLDYFSSCPRAGSILVEAANANIRSMTTSFRTAVSCSTEDQLRRTVHSRVRVSDTEARAIYKGNDGARHQALFRDAYELSRQEQITILRPDYHPGANELSRANSRVWSIPFEN